MIRSRKLKRIGKVVLDASIVGAAFWLAFELRFEGEMPTPYFEGMLFYLPIVLALKLFILALAGQFKATWRFVNLGDTVRLFGWLLPVSAAMFVWSTVRESLPIAAAEDEMYVLPLGVIALDLVLSFMGMVGVRTIARLRNERREHRTLGRAPANRMPTLLFGAGRAGALVAKEIRARPDNGIDLVGFLDDDDNLHDMEVEGLPVLGGANDLSRIAKHLRVRQVIITIANAQENALPRIVRLCEASGLRTKIIPPLHDIVEGKINLSKLREVSIADLLRRSPIQLEIGAVEGIVKGRTVLVTGAGGSIGSELCRLVARLQPEALVLVEQAENSLFHIHQELLEVFPNLNIVPCIADICDERRMDAIFQEWRPALVLHAAAHKHVPMMEWNPGEAVKNNVLGTKTIALLADAWEVQRFVMISTDKAVNPTSVMGVSKRVAELFIQSLSKKSATQFMTVRFGNVLGSAGSVIPTFQRQIAAGGPVTVTHPDMQRFFMTIPEACQLVLQAAAMGKGGELFILDMGAPVKIVDLARDLIRLSGLTPHQDIEIRYTGLRPGEKLSEELSLGEEGALKTKHPRIFIGQVKAPALQWMGDQLEELKELAAESEVGPILAKFKAIVPEFRAETVRHDAAASMHMAGPHEQAAPVCSS